MFPAVLINFVVLYVNYPCCVCVCVSCSRPLFLRLMPIEGTLVVVALVVVMATLRMD